MYIYKVCGMRLNCAAEQEVPYAAVKHFLELKEQGFWLGDWFTNFKTYNVGDCLHGDSNGGPYGK